MILLDAIVPFMSQHFVLSSALRRDQWQLTLMEGTVVN